MESIPRMLIDYLEKDITNSKGEKFGEWKEKNKISDYGHPNSYYDYMGAFQDGIQKGKNGHWPDTYKLPGHPTFSTESKYYKPNTGQNVGVWVNNKYVPLGHDEKGNEILTAEIMKTMSVNEESVIDHLKKPLEKMLTTEKPISADAVGTLWNPSPEQSKLWNKQ